MGGAAAPNSKTLASLEEQGREEEPGKVVGWEELNPS